MVERDHTGGECLWTGCVPSKALIEAADLAHRMRRADRVGLTPVEPEIDLAVVLAHVRQAQAVIEPHDAPERVRAAGAEVLADEATFVGPGQVRLKSTEAVLRPRAVLVAVGSAPVVPAVPGLAAARPLTSDTVWDLDALPARLLVLGGGPVGCELGQAFARLGSRVTWSTRRPGCCPARIRRWASSSRPPDRRGRRRPDRQQRGDCRGRWTLAGAGGRYPAGRGYRRPDPGGRWPTTTNRRARAGERGRTAHHERGGAGRRPDEDDGPRGYAAGDVTGILPFTHVAAAQAGTAALNALFWLPRRMRYLPMPYVVFTDPEVARVALSAAQARHRWGAGR